MPVPLILENDPFCSDGPSDVRQISRVPRCRGPIMAVPKNAKHKDYVRYAQHCLEMVALAKNQPARSLQREMAAEWLRLADEVLQEAHPV